LTRSPSALIRPLDSGMPDGGAGWNGTSCMIVCSCNAITMAEIRRAIQDLHDEPEPRIVTPGVVYRRLGYRPQCGCCLGTVAQAIDDSLADCCCEGRCKLKS
jgi:bacterioferritin-associated ferredoxin